ncbi:MAG: PAS domain S-box protein [Verrucomicrobia bacterium]|nr:PAS domain S-box protein [Verrucomicrobiota bacterium]MBI3868884.1 PAS domain S-box protein [Verrucomicrobiota bacterium]
MNPLVELDELDERTFQRALSSSIDQTQQQIAAGDSTVERWNSFLEAALRLTSSAGGFVAIRRDLGNSPLVATLEASAGFSISDPWWTALAERWVREASASGKPAVFDTESLNTDAPIPGFQSAVALPLIVAGRGMGVLALVDRPGGYTDSLLESLQPLVNAGACLLSFQLLERRHQKTELEMARVSDRFNNVLHSIEELVWVGLPGEIEPIYLNAAFERIWGCSFDEFRGNPGRLLETFHPEDRELFLETLRLQAKGRSTSLHYRIIRPDGAIRWIWDRAFPVVDAQGLVVSVNGLAADVTERKESEQALQRSEERLRAIYEQMPDSVFLIDVDVPQTPAKIIYANAEAARSHGVSVEEMLGRSIVEFENEESGARVPERTELLRSGETARFEVEHVRRD